MEKSNEQRWSRVEVAPPPMISPQRYTSASPKLETIFEEACGSHSHLMPPHPKDSDHMRVDPPKTSEPHLPLRGVIAMSWGFR